MMKRFLQSTQKNFGGSIPYQLYTSLTRGTQHGIRQRQCESVMAVTLFPSPQKMNSMMSRIFIKDISGLEGLMKQLKETGLE